MGVSGRTSKISSIVAAICIIVYIGAISFAAVQIIINIGERRNLAQIEFYDLTDRASSSAVFLGFMSEPYRETIRDFISGSETLLAVIITGSGNDYAFERYQGSGIVWTGNTPNFKSRIGLPGEPFFLPLRIEGHWNVTVQAIYSFIDLGFLVEILRNTLIAVLAALAIAFVTLMIELTRKNRISVSPDAEDYPPKTTKHSNAAEPPAARETYTEDDENPQGLFTPRGNIGWESYTTDRLSSELQRCASFEQDLTLLCMDFNVSESIDDELYRQFTGEAVKFFTMRDLIFEQGENGISVIIPSMNLEAGLTKSEEFRGRIIDQLPEYFEDREQLCIGLSSRSGRLIDADRLILEASTALEKAMVDPAASIIAFKSDPEKYRQFVKKHP